MILSIANILKVFLFQYKMEKVILTSQECKNLIPHWPELQERSIEHLLRMSVRKSNFDSEINVMSPVGIVIMDDGYIVNGKHRATIGGWCEYNLEAYVVKGEHDVIYHLTHKAYGKTGKEGLIRAINEKEYLVNLCKQDEIFSINDLIKKYLGTLL